MLDYAAWAKTRNIPIEPFSTTAISVDTLKDVATSQGTELKQGDILFIRSGWIQAFSQLTDSEAIELAEIPSPPAIGLESSEKSLRWLWETGFAAVAGDMPSMEAWPCQNTQFWLHEWLLAGWGMPIGELFDLERLGEECKKRGKWSFFFSSMPLRVSHESMTSIRELTIPIGPRRCCKPTKWGGNSLANRELARRGIYGFRRYVREMKIN